MLIKIHSSVVDLEDVNTLSDEVIYALEILALSRREGKHAVIADRNTLHKIYQCIHLSKNAKNTYLKLYNDSSKFRSMYSLVTKYIEVISSREVTNSCLVPRVITSQNHEIIQVSPGFFKDSGLAQEAVLLCEHSNDCYFYEYIAKSCALWSGNRIHLAFDPRGGGGSTIANEYATIQSGSNRFCLCIVDSDKIAPKSPLGSTARRIKDEDDEAQVITAYFIIEPREIENLIPMAILNKLCSNDPNYQSSLRMFEAITNSLALEIKFYLDIKNGSSMAKVFSSSNPEIKRFWSENIEHIPDILNHIEQWCLSEQQCGSPSRCACQIPLKFGSRILDNVISLIKGISLNTWARSVDDRHRAEWMEIGQVVIDWCFAEGAIRA